MKFQDGTWLPKILEMSLTGAYYVTKIEENWVQPLRLELVLKQLDHLQRLLIKHKSSSTMLTDYMGTILTIGRNRGE